MIIQTTGMDMEFETTVENFLRQAKRYHLQPKTSVKVIVKNSEDEQDQILPWISFEERKQILDSMPKVNEDSEKWIELIQESRMDTDRIPFNEE